MGYPSLGRSPYGVMMRTATSTASGLLAARRDAVTLIEDNARLQDLSSFGVKGFGFRGCQFFLWGFRVRSIPPIVMAP